MADPVPDADPAVLVSDVSLGYPAGGGRRAYNAVEGLGFTLGRGKTLALLGESGSGKSTLTRFIAGRGSEAADAHARIRITGGDATVLGLSLRRLKRRGLQQLTAHVGYLAQDAGSTLPAELNVGDILFSPIAERTRHFDRAQLSQQIVEMMGDDDERVVTWDALCAETG